MPENLEATSLVRLLSQSKNIFQNLFLFPHVLSCEVAKWKSISMTQMSFLSESKAFCTLRLPDAPDTEAECQEFGCHAGIQTGNLFICKADQPEFLRDMKLCLNAFQIR